MWLVLHVTEEEIYYDIHHCWVAIVFCGISLYLMTDEYRLVDSRTSYTYQQPLCITIICGLTGQYKAVRFTTLLAQWPSWSQTHQLTPVINSTHSLPYRLNQQIFWETVFKTIWRLPLHIFQSRHMVCCQPPSLHDGRECLALQTYVPWQQGWCHDWKQLWRLLWLLVFTDRLVLGTSTGVIDTLSASLNFEVG